MNGTQQLQIASECLKNTMNFGETTVRNICDGTVSVVPWGGVDWAFAVLIGALISTLVVMLLGMVFTLFSDTFLGRY